MKKYLYCNNCKKVVSFTFRYLPDRMNNKFILECDNKCGMEYII